MIIDTHAHVNFNAFKDDADEVIRRALNEKIWLINVGSQYSTSKRAVEMAAKYSEGVYAAVGLHPIHLETGLVKIKEDPQEVQFQTKEETFDYEKYKELAKSKKVVAIGEVGFDYYWKPKTQKKLADFQQKQRDIFHSQLELAQELDLPLIIHCRMAHDQLLEAICSHRDKLRGVLHCHTANWEKTKECLDTEFYFGFNGLIFKMPSSEEVIKNLPLEKILVETDAPYLTPPQEEGRNEPIYIKHVVSRIAQIKGLSYEKVAEATTQNAKNLFKI
ncbi:MAG: TatD family hydrolase [Candidatus Nealsonbacteria bacterium]|nr:TatD family hydrolase [Candidatus Nealsonbacteria bacterium]